MTFDWTPSWYSKSGRRPPKRRNLHALDYGKLQEMLPHFRGNTAAWRAFCLTLPTPQLLIVVEYCRRNMTPNPMTYGDGIANHLLPELIRRVEHSTTKPNCKRFTSGKQPR